MGDGAQAKALRDYRARLAGRGFVRFELQAEPGDRDLLRIVARKLAEGGIPAQDFRRSLVALVRESPPRRGGVLAAFLNTAFAGSELDLSHPPDSGHAIDL